MLCHKPVRGCFISTRPHPDCSGHCSLWSHGLFDDAFISASADISQRLTQLSCCRWTNFGQILIAAYCSSAICLCFCNLPGAHGNYNEETWENIQVNRNYACGNRGKKSNNSPKTWFEHVWPKYVDDRERL